MLERSVLRAVLQPIERARPFPREAYTAPEVFSWEREVLLGNTALASESDLPRPGSWLRAAVPDDRIVVARAAELSLRAFRDVCKHRGAVLLGSDRGQLPTLCAECPYHGWTYELTGALQRAPGMPNTFDRKKHGLDAFATKVVLGQCFVQTHGAEPLPTLPPWLAALRLGALRRARCVRWSVRANWKFLLENFQESQHFLRVHPGLQHWTPFSRSQSLTEHAHEGWLGGTMELEPHAETVSRSGKRSGRPWIVPEEQRRTVFDAYLFPNVLTSLQPDYLLVYRLYPQSPSHTLIDGEMYVHPEASEASCEELYSFWDQTNDEDRQICERQQDGTSSHGWRALCYAPSEDGMHAFDQLLARKLLATLPARRSKR